MALLVLFAAAAGAGVVAADFIAFDHLLVAAVRSAVAPDHLQLGQFLFLLALDVAGEVLDGSLGDGALLLRDIMGPRWSPNGQSIVFTAFPQENEDLYVVSANGGAPRRLTTHPAEDAWPYWSHDSRLLYFRSSRTGRPEIWKMPSSGGEAVQMTRNGGDYPQESPDGKFVYYERGWPSLCGVWRIPVEGGEETRVLDGVLPSGKWAVGKEGIYFFTGSRGRSNTDICLYEFATGKTKKVLTIKECTDAYIAVSPDGRTILYPQLDQVGSDLMLVENFR